MKQTINLTVSQKQHLAPKLSESLVLLSASNHVLEKKLNDYAIDNPLIDIALPKKTYSPQPFTKYNSSRSLPTTSLDMHLIQQIQYLKLDDQQKKAMLFIIASLDESGFLKENASVISKKTNLSLTTVTKLLSMLKTLDPPGIGAIDYKESLLIQLKAKGLFSDSAMQIIQNHLPELSRQDFNAIENVSGIQVDDAKKLLNEIKKLSPFPAKAFCSNPAVSYIEPDIIITTHGENLKVSLNPQTVYRIRISNNDYISNAALYESEQQYINTMLREARWLERSLQKRYDTLLRCAKSISDAQKNFFLHGESHLVPLRKKDIANILHLHPSTVTRALSDKTIKSSHGLHPTSFFFSGRSCFSNKYSPIQLKYLIKEIIEKENKCYPETDESITTYLNASGIQISRRTVAMYRAQIGISPANIRRRT